MAEELFPSRHIYDVFPASIPMRDTFSRSVVCISMRKTTDRNFNKRFGDRISMVFADKPLDQKVQNNALYKAVTEVMAGILRREPTEAELLGLEDVSVHKAKK